MKYLLARIGDPVIVHEVGSGRIIKIGFDSNAKEIYTVCLDFGKGDYLARHEELTWI